MRHGWSEFAELNPDHSGWRCGVAAVREQAPVFCDSGFDAIVPFYKDRGFREVSLCCILKALGAVRIEGQVEDDGTQQLRVLGGSE